MTRPDTDLTSDLPKSPSVLPARPGQVALAALLLALVIVGLRLSVKDWNASTFARFGDRHVDVSQAPDDAFIDEGTGYDGQYFYRIARDPFSRADRVDGVDLDRPAFRTRRIVYPAAAWALSAGGQQAVVPWALIGVNVLAWTLLAWGIATAAHEEGASAWWGLLAVSWPGFLIALTGDLSELSVGAGIAWALVYLRRRRWLGATVLLMVAVLARESAALVALGVTAAAVLGRVPLARRWRFGSDGDGPPIWSGLLPLAVLAGWLALVDRWWEGHETETAMGQTADQFGVPLYHQVAQLFSFIGDIGDTVALYQFFQYVLVLAVAVAAALALRNPSAGSPTERSSLLLALAATSMLVTWDRAVVFLRYPNEIVLIAAVIATTARAPMLARVLKRVIPALFITALPVWITIT